MSARPISAQLIPPHLYLWVVTQHFPLESSPNTPRSGRVSPLRWATHTPVSVSWCVPAPVVWRCFKEPHPFLDRLPTQLPALPLPHTPVSVGCCSESAASAWTDTVARPRAGRRRLGGYGPASETSGTAVMTGCHTVRAGREGGEGTIRYRVKAIIG